MIEKRIDFTLAGNADRTYTHENSEALMCFKTLVFIEGT